MMTQNQAGHGTLKPFVTSLLISATLVGICICRCGYRSAPLLPRGAELRLRRPQGISRGVCLGYE